MKAKFVLVLIFVIILTTLLVYANGMHNENNEEDISIRHQFDEINPFPYFAEKHIFTGIVLIVLWASFFYLIYTLTQLLIKKKIG